MCKICGFERKMIKKTWMEIFTVLGLIKQLPHILFGWIKRVEKSAVPLK